MMDVVINAVCDSLKPEWDNSTETMVTSDSCVLRSIRSTYKTSIGDAVEALASITDALPSTDGPWAQIVKAITEKILSHPTSVYLLTERTNAVDVSEKELTLLQETLSNMIWDTLLAWVDDNEEENTSVFHTNLTRINELTTLWGRAKDINRLAILTFIVVFTYGCY